MLAFLVESELRGELAAPVEGGINAEMASAGGRLDTMANSALATAWTAESFALLDVAGMNYADSRYETDAALFPNRVILGTETFPTRIDGLWGLVERHGRVIGDFTWTGWDYLGEVGGGWPQYRDADARPVLAPPPYPALLAGSGDIDILGNRRPASYYREIVFGLRSQPYLAVWRPEHWGRTFAGSPWAWSDAIASWTWPGFEGRPIVVEVYAAAEEVELLVNGESVGRKRIDRFRAEFDTVYNPGLLEAVAYRDGLEIGRDAVPTATGPLSLSAVAEREAIGSGHGELAFVALSFCDVAGTVHPAADVPVTVSVSGPAVLVGFGSANPSTEELFGADTHLTYEGRALAVLRPTGPGEVRLVATASGCEPATVLIVVND